MSEDTPVYCYSPMCIFHVMKNICLIAKPIIVDGVCIRCRRKPVWFELKDKQNA